MRKTWKRGLSFLVSLSMVLGLVPTSALAEAVEEMAKPDDEVVLNVDTQEQPAENLDDQGSGGGSSSAAVAQSDEGEPSKGVAAQDDGVVAQGTEDSPTAVQLNEDCAVTAAEGEFWYGVFTATTDGWYDFSLSIENNTSVIALSEDQTYIYDQYGRDYAYAYNYKPVTVMRHLSAGNSLYVKVNGDSQSTSGTLRVTESTHDYHELELADFDIQPREFVLPDTVSSGAVSLRDVAGNDVNPEYYELVYYTDDGNYTELGTVTPSEGGGYNVAARAIPNNAGGYTGETSKVDIHIVDANDIGGSRWHAKWNDKQEYETAEIEYVGVPLQVPAATIWSTKTDESVDVTLEKGTHYEISSIRNTNRDVEVESIEGRGSYEVTFEGRDPYSGTRILSIYVTGLSNLGYGYVSLYATEYSPSAEGVVLSYTVYNSESSPLSADDYDLVYYRQSDDSSGYVELGAAPTEAGEYYVAARAKDNSNEYVGETPKVQFVVFGENNIGSSAWEASFSEDAISYTGEPVVLSSPTIATYDENWNPTYLREGTDFEFLRFEDPDGQTVDTPSDKGTWYAVYSGIGSYTGTRRIPFSIVDPYDISTGYWNGMFVPNMFVAYTGEAVTLPTPHIYHYNSQTAQDEDLASSAFAFDHIENSSGEVVENPINIGSYTVWYRGVGPYSGIRSIYFEIVDASNLAEGSIELENTVVAAVGDLNPVVKNRTGNEVDPSYYDLVYYEQDGETLLDAAPTVAGTYYVSAKAKDGNAGGYTGETSQAQFTILQPLTAEELTLDQTRTVSPSQYDDNLGHDCWFGKFTAEDMGPYAFYLASDSGIESGLYSDAFGQNELITGSGDDYRLIRNLQANEAVYIKLWQNEGMVIQADICVKKVDAHDLDAAQLSLEKDTFVHSDQVVLSATVTDAAGSVVDPSYYELYWSDDSGEEHRLLEGAPTAVGVYCIIARAIESNSGQYTGETAALYFSVVDPNDIGGNYWTRGYEIDENSYDTSLTLDFTGNVINVPALRVWRYDNETGNDVVLTEGTDYELDYILYHNNQVNQIKGPGIYTVYYKAKGNTYTGSFETQITVTGDDNNLAQGYLELSNTEFSVSDLENLSSDSTVFSWNNGWVDKSSYELVYYDSDGSTPLNAVPTTAGTYYVAARAIEESDYTGETPKVQFTIVNDNDLSRGHVDYYDGGCDEGSEPWIQVYSFSGSWIPDDCYDRVYYNQDGTTQLPAAPSTVGTYYVAARAVEGGGYTGETPKVQFEVRGTNNIAHSKWSQFSWQGEGVFAYTGSPIVLPKATISSFGSNGQIDQTLVEDTDFEFDYFEADNHERLDVAPTDCGLYYAVYKGKGSYTGVKKSLFRIAEPNDISDYYYWRHRFEPSDAITYTGQAITLPTIVIERNEDSENPERLTENTHFQFVGYRSPEGDQLEGPPSEIGYYYARYEGIAPYTGTVSIPFSIVSPYDFDYANVVPVLKDVEHREANGPGSYEILDDTADLLSLAWDLLFDGVALTVGEDYTITTYESHNWLDMEGNLIDLVDYVFQGTGQYSGSVWSRVYRIVADNPGATDLSGADVVVSGTFAYDGAAKVPEPTVTLDGTQLAKGTDYTVSYASNTNAGTATVTVTGRGSYKGSATASFTISPVDIGSEVVTLSGVSDKAFTGSAIEQDDLKLTLGSYQLVKDTDYTVAYADNTNRGTATITITAKSSNDGGSGNFTGARTQTFEIGGKSLATATIASVAEQTFTGSSIEPTPAVTLDGAVLVAGTDFEYGYANNLNAGTATITVTGKGNYAESTSTTFTIAQANIANATMSGLADATYTGSAIVQDGLALTLGTYALTTGDYDVAYANNENATTADAKATVTFTGKGNFTGTQTGQFAISPATITASMIEDIPDQTFTGSEVVPGPVVKLGDRTLAAGTDYDVAYSGNVHAGNGATVAVTGKGNFAGTAEKTFVIQRATITSVDAIDSQTYTGSPITPALTVKSGDRTLTDYDYDVSYSNNTNAGTATVTVTGKSDYQGTLNTSFTILRRAITAYDVTGIEESADFTGSAIIMPVEVTVNGHTLEAGSFADTNTGDYGITHSNNVNVGQATITITGRNNYTGEVTKHFTINPVAIDSDLVVVSGVEAKEYTGSSITQEGLTLTLGTYTLKEDTDYTVGYENNINKGEATITITAKPKDNGGSGNFIESRTVTFNITGKVLTEDNTTIGTIAPVTYNGEEQKPEPEVKVGQRTLTKGTDYELTYSNNTDVGTATVTITGKGDFGGTLTRDFTISPATITDVTGVTDATYTGENITFENLVVKAGDLTLTASDYDVVYANNKNVTAADAKATVTITCKGNFTGTKTEEFSIAPASIADAVVAIDQSTFAYDGTAYEPAVTSVTLGNKTLAAGTDYTVSYQDNTNVGAGRVIVTGTGNYTGTTNATFTITKARLDRVGGATIEPIADKTYMGAAIEPEVFVQLDGREVSPSEFDVAYANNTNVPAADATEGQLPTVTVTAKQDGNYEGSVSATFNIVPRSVEDALVTGVPATLTYTGGAITCEDLKVQVGTSELAKGNDYDVTYANNTNVGTATITIAGKGNHTDQKVVEFAIEPAAITSLTCAPATPYTGFAIEPTLTVKAGEQLTLTADDYDATFTNNTDVGTATVSVTGKGNFRGTETATFSIGQVDLGGANVTVDGIAPKTYDGTSQTQDALVLTLGNYQLVADKDYTVAYSDNTDAGQNTATITIKAKSTENGGSGNFTGTKTEHFTIAGRSIAAATVDGIVDQTYTGDHITPAVTVSMDDRVLTLGTDYTVSYDENTNTNVGTSTVTITGKGNYADTTTTSFRIVPMSLARAVVSVTGERSYTGAALTPAPTVKVGTHVVPAEAYTVAYANNTNVGTATVTVTAKEDNANYIDSAKGSFKITPQNISEDNNFAITAIPDQAFTGSALKPAVEVKVNGEAFDAANYDVAYANNTNAGTATVTVTGKGSYAGTKTANFAINPADLANVSVAGIEDKMHTGSALMQDNLTLTLGSYVLKEDTDYQVAYDNNIDVGNATITITPKQGGSGNFTGSTTASFKIGSLAIGDIEALTYNGAEQKPTPTVMAGDATLTEGTDFDFSYEQNTNAGTAKVTVTGKDAYAGSTATKEFTIKPAAVTSVTGAQGKTYTGEVLTQDGLVVKAGDMTLQPADYDITYNNNVNVGTATVIATGKGNFAGKKTTTFSIAALDLAAANVASITAIDDQTYTGKEIKPAVVVKVGGNVLDAKNYTVTYTNNVDQGQATVTVTAKEGTNYTGTLTANFAIGKKSLSGAQIGAISDQLYTGSDIEPTPTVTVDGKKLDASNYDVTWSNNTNVGEATVTITAKADTNYTGSTYRTFNIKARNIADCAVDGITAQTYTGNEIKPTLTITLGKQTLDATNYDVAYANNENVGTATITITGKNNCTGTTTVTFEIKPAEINALAGVETSAVYTGSPITFDNLVVKAGDIQLTANDYDVAYANNTNVGEATVAITAKGNFTGTLEQAFSIAGKSLEANMVSDIAAQTFTGAELKPAVVVTDGQKTLKEGTDYTVAYSDNVNAGEATATITGAGNYAGNASKSFTINKASFADVAISGVQDKEYTGEVHTQTGLTLTLGTYTLKDSDYAVTYPGDNYTSVGDKTFTVVPSDQGNFQGDPRDLTFRITEQLMSNENTTIELKDSEASFTYNGNEKRPAVAKVTFGNKELEYGKEYTVSYENNVNAGTAKVIVTGRDGYAGQASATFLIASASIADARVSSIADQPYTGNALTPDVVVTLGDDVLAKDKDYTVDYANNTNASTDENKATVTIKGTGNYKDSVEKTFTITQRSILDATIDPIDVQTYSGSALEPTAVVKLDGKELAASDYTVAYTKNTNVGTATVTVTGGDNFEQGYDQKLTTTFAIKPAQITEVKGISATMTYDDGSPIKFANLQVISGIKQLTPNQDYILAYRNNINVGKATLTVTARGNYTGGGTYQFLITPKSIVGYTVTMPTNDDGSEIIYSETANLDAFEPAPIVTNENAEELDPANYDVTYLNNSVAGEATVIVTGKGNYKDSPSTPGTFTIYKYAGTATSGGSNAVIWHVEDGGAMTIEPKIKKEGNDTATLGSASNLTWSQAVADYTENVKVDSGVKNCTDASGMFSGLTNATSVDVTDFDMSSVTNTSGMFEDCASLPSVDLSDKITENVSDMSNMFAGCESLSSIDLSGANTSNVTSMAGMFDGCSSLSITDLTAVFGQGAQQQGVQEQSSSAQDGGRNRAMRVSAQEDEGGFNTANVTDMSSMFRNCTGLSELDLNALNTEKVEDMSYMFAGCTGLRTLNIQSFDTGKVQAMTNMYDECELDQFTIGAQYANGNNPVGIEALPTPTASNGLWWKTGTDGNKERKWISTDGIIALGDQAADTYTNKGVLDTTYVSIESADITTGGTSYMYDGTEKSPAVTRVVLKTDDGEIELVPDADYRVGYRDNVDAGDDTAQVVVEGLGDYSGTALQTFTIGRKSITDATIQITKPSDSTYDGKAHNNEPVVKDTKRNKTLVKGIDYDLAWPADTKNVGSKSVTITGKGNYKDNTTTAYNVTRRKATVTANNASKTEGAKDPSLTATVSGTVGGDKLTYTVTRASGEKQGTYTITPKGNAVQGNYDVTYKTGTFTIKAPATPPAAHVAYRTHVQTYGWQGFVRDGAMSGTEGQAKRLEGIEVKLEGAPASGGIEYRTHVQTYGWQGYVANGAMSGTQGEAKRLEAIQIRLTGDMAKKYDVWYRVHAQTYGWLGWACNDQQAGTAGLAKRLEGIEIRVLPKGSAAPGSTDRPFVTSATASGSSPAGMHVAYRTHVQTFGWQGFVRDGVMSGTSGQAKRLEGIEIKLENAPASGGIEYRTHVQTYGWQAYKSNGAMSGTSGQAKRLEAIQIRLTGDMAQKYDVWYRVHAQTFGWMGWARNDQQAGTAGFAKRLEGIEIRVLPKGSPAPGSTGGAFRQK